MKHLNEYILNNEELVEINEVLTAGAILLYSLCGACGLHFSVKGMKKVRKHSGNFWDWALGKRDIVTQQAEESKEDIDEPINEKKFDKSKVQPMQVTDNNVLDKLMEKMKSDAKKKSGFYVFDNLFKETPELKKINKNPYYANYVVFMDAGSEDNEDEKPNFYGMIGFSLKYWKVIAKRGKDEKIKKAAQDLTKYISIFAVQTDKKYAKKGLFEVYLEDMKNAVKEAKMDGLTIKYENDELAEVFANYGFEKIEGLDGYMKLSLNKGDEENQ